MASILGYTRVAILANTDAYGSGVASAFMEACKQENIDVPLYLSFEPVDSGAEQDLDSKLMQIKSAGLRVIMLAGQVGAPKPARPSAQNLPPPRGDVRVSGRATCSAGVPVHGRALGCHHAVATQLHSLVPQLHRD